MGLTPNSQQDNNGNAFITSSLTDAILGLAMFVDSIEVKLVGPKHVVHAIAGKVCLLAEELRAPLVVPYAYRRTKKERVDMLTKPSSFGSSGKVKQGKSSVALL